MPFQNLSGKNMITNYVQHKYCEEGYLHFHPGDEYSLKGLNGLRDLLKDKERFATVCKQYL